MQKAEKRLLGILKRAKSAGLTTQEIRKQFNNNSCDIVLGKKSNWKKCVYIGLLLICTVGPYLYMQIFSSDKECLIGMPFDGTKVFRKPEDCSLCQDVTQVDRVTNISHEDFEVGYATKAKPVIVTDGTRDWAAGKVFDFQFFKELYEKHRGGKTECQFFPYKTDFDSLRDALNMPLDRSQLKTGTAPWYIGWSNCNDAAGKILRQHYQRPYFLPSTSENMALSWIFMGGPGDGAHMHVDNVHYASWQAQLRGRKKWRLAPPPECYYACKEFQAIVEPGEILVVDTNRWYHQTHILPGDISITIGTEFD